MASKKGGYIATGMTEEQLKKATKEEIKIKKFDSLLQYEKKGYSVHDRNKLFSNHIKSKTQKPSVANRKKIAEKITYKVELPRVDLDNIITDINGGCTRLGYY